MSTIRVRSLILFFSDHILFFSLDMWMLLFLAIITYLHLITSEKIGANLNSVHFSVGDVSMTTWEIKQLMLTRMEEVYADLRVAMEAMEDLSPGEIKDILPEVDDISSKFMWISESTEILQDFILEALSKKISLLFSLCFFYTHVIVAKVGLTKMSNLFANKVVMFTVIMFGNILIFICNSSSTLILRAT